METQQQMQSNEKEMQTLTQQLAKREAELARAEETIRREQQQIQKVKQCMGVCGCVDVHLCMHVYIAVIFMNCATANSRRHYKTMYSEKDELLQAKDVAQTATETACKLYTWCDMHEWRVNFQHYIYIVSVHNYKWWCLHIHDVVMNNGFLLAGD